MSLKILMIVRPTLYSTPGGDTTQILMTAKYLRLLNVNVDIEFSGAKFDIHKYDLLHFFNIIRPDDILPYLKFKLPIVLSTVFVDYSEFDRFYRKGVSGVLFKFLSPGKIEYLKAIARWVKNGNRIRSIYYLLNGHDRSVRNIAQKTSILLPNSNSEYFRFKKYFGVEVPYRKIVNAIDKDVFTGDILPNPKFKNHIICVGRIEGIKNQLNLIKAFMDSKIPLTIIGKAAPNHYDYFKECQLLAEQTDNIKIIEYMEHKELVGIYKAAKVHVLPSWFETTGLSSLEAAVMDCNIVISRKGDTEEYFGDMAYYCEPDDLSSIREAVIRAYNEPLNPRLKPFILGNYIWEKTAEQTLDAYKEVISKKI